MDAINISRLTKKFGNLVAVDDISFSVKKGEVFGFLGPNGAGKTTTIRMMMDFVRPSSGTVSIFGKDAQKDSVELKKRIGFLSGEVHLYPNWTGADHIEFARYLNGKSDISSDLVMRLGFDPTKKTRTLSSGNKQKLGIILAFMSNPELIILDEPTNGLDPLLQNEVYEMIRESIERGATVFMSSHNLPEVERVCDSVGIIKKGKIIARESITSLKRKKVYSVKLFLKDEKNILSELENKHEVIRKDARGVELMVKSDISEFIHEISRYDICDIEITQGSLEDIFLEYYHT